MAPRTRLKKLIRSPFFCYDFEDTVLILEKKCSEKNI